MNERFYELCHARLIETGFDVERIMKPYPGGFPREDMLALESFAELIYKDIITVVAAQALMNESALDVFKNLRKLYEGIEE